ncbi:MAG: AarF/ABC1/UbiB kinase family protein [Anaerolineae bacterium]|nr:AarF/ABC1/UbiB kinase family protein [Anaerolineae bacterium]
MPSSQIPTSTSDSLSQRQRTAPSNEQVNVGAAVAEAAPAFPKPDTNGTTNGSHADGSGATSEVAADGVVPPDAGRRIPIPIGDEAAAEPAATAGQPKASPPPKPQPRQSTFPGAGLVPDVMQHGREQVPPSETVEQYVNRMRPRSLRMRLRFWHTLVFALWLFGRLIFWNIYVSRYFPRWVYNGNTRRWRKYARQFRNFATEMGGVHIKAGQFASTRADILPEEVIAELASLQDEVPTIDFRRISRTIEDELGNPDNRFQYIDPEPLAAASLGQVHRARLNNGDKVVIKVQRPGIREIVYTDLAALFIVAKVAMRFRFVSRRVDAEMLVDEFGRVLLEEVSYIQEAENAQRFDRMFSHDRGVQVPHIYREHSTDLVLTLEDVTTLKINDFEALEAYGVDRRQVAERLMDTYMIQIFDQRFFHADPHPGNLFVKPLPVPEADERRYVEQGGGRPFELIFIDFGMTGSLTPQIANGLVNTLKAVITRDARALVQSYVQLGLLLPSADTIRLEEAIKAVFDQVWGLSMTEINQVEFDVMSGIAGEFNDILKDIPFRLPQDFIYLGRTVGILTGMATSLDPTFNPWQSIQSNMQRFILTDEEADFVGEMRKAFLMPIEEALTGGPQGLLNALQRVSQQLIYRLQSPERIEKMLGEIVSGDIAVQTKLSQQHRRMLENIDANGRRTTRMVLVGSLVISATMLYTNGDVDMAAAALGAAGIIYVTTLFIGRS